MLDYTLQQLHAVKNFRVTILNHLSHILQVCFGSVSCQRVPLGVHSGDVDSDILENEFDMAFDHKDILNTFIQRRKDGKV